MTSNKWGTPDPDTTPQWGAPEDTESNPWLEQTSEGETTQWGTEEDTAQEAPGWGEPETTTETPQWGEPAQDNQTGGDAGTNQEVTNSWDTSDQEENPWLAADTASSSKDATSIPVDDLGVSPSTPEWEAALDYQQDEQMMGSVVHPWDTSGDYEDTSVGDIFETHQQSQGFDAYAQNTDYDEEDNAGSLQVDGEEKKLPKWVILLVSAVVLLGAGAAALLLFGGDDNEPAPQDTPAATSTPASTETAEPTESASTNSVEQFNGFTTKLSKAMTDRDAKAYHALLSEQSQKDNKVESVEKALSQLPAGATYKVTAKDASVAGPTAAVTFKQEQTLKGKTTSTETSANLKQENGEWKLVVEPSNTQ